MTSSSLIPWSEHDGKLSRRNRLVLLYLCGLTVIILLYTVLYNYGMRTLEGDHITIFRSFQTVIETMTTTGYGAGAPWETPIMNLFMVFMQLTGIGIGFFTLRLVVIPLFSRAEVDLDERLTPKNDHVIICEYRRDSALLLDELTELGIDYVLISSNEEDAKRLSDDGYSVIHGSPQDATTFERASIDTASAIITDAGDANVNTILTVRSLRSGIEIIALTDDSDLREVLSRTGATEVLSPHGAIGQRLAEKAVSEFTAELRDTIDIGGDIEITEIPIHRDSPLNGERIRDSDVRERTGANIIGAWIDGELQLPPDPDAIIRPNTVLLVSGGHGELENLSEFTRPVRSLHEDDHAILAGLGEVGRAARSVIEREGIDVATIDIQDGEGVDVVADTGAEDALREAGIEDAGAIVIGVPDDSTALLTTVLARSLNPDVEILARVNDTDTTTKALRAGADYVLSVPRTSARMIARELRGEDVLGPASQIRVVRVPATPFADTTLAESEIYERTGCRVIAIEGESGLSTTIDPQQTLSADDRLTIIGTDEAIQAFLTQFDVSPDDPVERD